ncbi:MAG: lysine-sensitive aspartokinase 3 [Planctomycetes bacterium]|nr:lysine-sensitive aspartokinase 3 [Planctomycetota bacterium]
MTKILKFGGSSLASAELLRQVAALVRAALPDAPIVVLSASGKTTDALHAAARAAERGDVAVARERASEVRTHHAELARGLFGDSMPPELAAELDLECTALERRLDGVALLRELSPRSLDAIVSAGELLSTRLFAAWLAREELDCEWFDARRVLRTDARFGSAEPDVARIRELCERELGPRVRPGRAIVTQGYIGSTAAGVTTTLGRGGSDWSAALLGAAVGASEVQIWTDVEGVYSADPRVVPAAHPIAELSFAEAAELAAFGAKVLHPATIQPAIERRIPVTVRHTARPNGRFTTIRAEAASGRPLAGLASRSPVTLLTVTSTRMLAQAGFLARLFEVFGRHGASVDLVATAEVSVSSTLEPDAPLDAIRAELEPFARVDVVPDRAIVAVVGERLKLTPGTAARVLAAAGEVHIELISMGANEINLSLVVGREDEHELVRRLHAALLETDRPTGSPAR